MPELVYFISGFALTLVWSFWYRGMYSNILELKAKERSAEKINGKFYMIVPEDEYIRNLTISHRRVEELLDEALHAPPPEDKP